MSNTIEKLEQQIAQLQESQKQKSIIKLCERLDKAEQQKAELIKLVCSKCRIEKLCRKNNTVCDDLRKYIKQEDKDEC